LQFKIIDTERIFRAGNLAEGVPQMTHQRTHAGLSHRRAVGFKPLILVSEAKGECGVNTKSVGERTSFIILLTLYY
jgi:hypothetical protein